ncbi:MAG: portal protein [Casimicrobium sp.]
MAELTIREQVQRRLQGMKAVRKPYETDWEEINRLAMPARGEFLGSSNSRQNNSRRANTTSRDSHPRRAARTLAYGMQSGLSPSVMPWFKLKTVDPDQAEFQENKEWLAVVEGRIYAFFADIGIYDTFKLTYLELGNYGVGSGTLLENSEYGGASHAMTAGEYYIATDDAGRANTLYRHVNMTVSQLVHSFEWNRLSKTVQQAWSANNVQAIVPCVHAIEPNHDRDPTKIDVGNKPFKSIWFEPGNDDKTMLLRTGGYDSKPFWAPRWEVTGSAVYSDACPGFDALPDLRELQLSARRRSRAKDMINAPPMKAPTGLASTMIRMDPGSVTFAAASDLEGLAPIFQPDYRALQAIREDHYELRNDVDACYYVDLFKAISDREGVQPLNDLEASLRNDEKFTQLGPVVDRVNVEMLEVAVERAFVILSNLGQLPEPPKALQGKPLVVDFVSVLAQAQRSSQNSAIERMARFVGFIAGLFPEAAIKFDAEQAIDEFATGTGTPPKIVRSDEIVEKLRQQQAAAQQQQQMADMAQPMQQAAQAAELLSRTNVGGDTTALQQLMGQ